MREFRRNSQGKENAVKCELAGEILRRFGSLRLQVKGHSMLPSVWPGDVLLIKRCHFSQISSGDIVLYAREGRFFAHRVIGASVDLVEPRLVTQGDALPSEDCPISPVEFLGKVSQIVRAGECSEPASVLAFKEGLVASAARYSTIFARLLVHLRMTRRNSGKRETPC